MSRSGEEGRLTVTQVDEIELDYIMVPGDPSSAAFVVAAACSCRARASWSGTWG